MDRILRRDGEWMLVAGGHYQIAAEIADKAGGPRKDLGCSGGRHRGIVRSKIQAVDEFPAGCLGEGDHFIHFRGHRHRINPGGLMNYQ